MFFLCYSREFFDEFSSVENMHVIDCSKIVTHSNSLFLGISNPFAYVYYRIRCFSVGVQRNTSCSRRRRRRHCTLQISLQQCRVN